MTSLSSLRQARLQTARNLTLRRRISPAGGGVQPAEGGIKDGTGPGLHFREQSFGHSCRFAQNTTFINFCSLLRVLDAFCHSCHFPRRFPWCSASFYTLIPGYSAPTPLIRQA